jgi:hypothetical protein
MIPAHNQSGVLPPFIPGATPVDGGAMAPYPVTLIDIGRRFATNEKRKQILQGLTSYRKALREVGIVEGFQWLDGSFVEKVETTRGRPPNDIDIVTFSYRPKESKETNDWRQLIHSRPDLFDPEVSKNRYHCDAYFVDMSVHPRLLVDQTKYWFGLFSHQRETFLWKGMLEVSLEEDESYLMAYLSEGDRHAT